MSKIDDYLKQYKADHQHPMNKATHMVGIPMIIISLPLMFFAPPIGIGLFVLGWIFQFIGHAFEGKAPSFFRHPHVPAGGRHLVRQAPGVVRDGQAVRRAAASGVIPRSIA